MRRERPQKLRIRVDQGIYRHKDSVGWNEGGERYRWKFVPDKESGVAWTRGKPPVVFPEV